MNLQALKNNIKYAISTSVSVYDLPKRLMWTYEVSKVLGIAQKSAYLLRFHFPSVGTVKLMVRNNRGADAFIISEVFLHESYKLDLALQRGAHLTIVDLGANAGYTSVYFARLFPDARIICVEPVPDNLKLLKKNLQLNNIDADVVEGAVSVSDGTISMALSAQDYGHKVDGIDYGRSLSSGNRIEVPAISMKKIITDLRLTSIGILKIDIEGYEGVLLQKNNDWLSVVETVIMEVHEHVSISDLQAIFGQYHFNCGVQRKGNWIFTKQKQAAC